MAYLCRVGPNTANLSGVEARGYRIFRRGTKVRVVWGPIGIDRGRQISFYWCRSTVYTEYRRRTVKEAQKLLRNIMEFQIQQGYFKLPPGSHIAPRELANGVTRRS
jgi:hypothetical protein